MKFPSMAARYLLLALVFASAQTAFAASIPESVQEQIRARVDGEKTMSIIVGIVDPDGRSYFSYGTTDKTGGVVPDENTVYEIGSVTKVFTGILLADMVKRGEVAYDDTIDKYLPEGTETPTRNDESITLGHLSEQTSGLPRLPGALRVTYPNNPYAAFTVEQLYESVSMVTLARDIGEKYEYSNFGVGLLGHLLERVSGKSYEELVKERIAGPVGMPDTGITLTDDMVRRLAKGHQGDQVVGNWDLPALAGAGALRSTAKDMLAFLEANLGLVETTLGGAMRESHQPRAGAGPGMQIGLGWHIRKSDLGPIVWHNGGTGGYRSFTGFIAETKTGVVVLTNSGGPGDDDIGLHALDPSIPMNPFTPRETVAVSPEILERYVGRYRLTPKVQFDVRLKDGQLSVQLSGQPRFPVFPSSETEFFMKVVDAQISFVEDDNGDIESLVLHQNGFNQTANRIE